MVRPLIGTSWAFGTPSACGSAVPGAPAPPGPLADRGGPRELVQSWSWSLVYPAPHPHHHHHHPENSWDA